MTQDDHSGPDVVGTTEAAAIIGVSVRRLAAIVDHPARGRAPFPTATQLERMRVWDRAEVQAWAQDRTGRALAVLRAHRAGLPIRDVAAAGDVTPGTARKWLRGLDAWKPPRP